MKTVKQAGLASIRAELKVKLYQVRELRERAKAMRQAIRDEFDATREARKDAKVAKVKATADRRVARIAKLEAKLAALKNRVLAPKSVRAKNRKASKPVNLMVASA